MSSVSTIANGGQNYAPQQLQASVGLLAANLATNNLSGARRAFSGLQQVLGQPSTATPLGNDISQLGQALKSGDLGGARQIFARLGQNGNSSAGSGAAATSSSASQPDTTDATDQPTVSPVLPGAGRSLDIAV